MKLTRLLSGLLAGLIAVALLSSSASAAGHAGATSRAARCQSFEAHAAKAIATKVPKRAKRLRRECRKAAQAKANKTRPSSSAAAPSTPSAATEANAEVATSAAATPAASSTPTTTTTSTTPTSPTTPTTPSSPTTPTSTPSGSASGFVVGIDGGYSGWSNAETEQRAALGAAVTRHEWMPSEALSAQDALVERAVSQVHTRLQALIALEGTPSSYAAYVVAFIKRYGVGGSFWAAHPSYDASKYAITDFELGNEPYFEGWEGSQYASFIKPTLEAVKAQGLPARMIVDSRTYGTEARYVDPLYAVIPNLNELIWGFAEHPYDYGVRPSEGGSASPFLRLKVTREHINAHGGASKPILVTEYGQSTANCGSECESEARQAEDLQAMLEFCRRPEMNIEALFFYQLIDRGTNTSSRELQFGLLRQDGSAKPAWNVVQAAAGLYRG